MAAVWIASRCSVSASRLRMVVARLSRMAVYYQLIYATIARLSGAENCFFN